MILKFQSQGIFVHLWYYDSLKFLRTSCAPHFVGETSNDTRSTDRPTDRTSYYQITFVCATYASTRHSSIQTIFPKQLRFWSYNQFYRILGMYTICSPLENPSAMNMLDWEYWKGERGSNTQHKKVDSKVKRKRKMLLYLLSGLPLMHGI